MNNTRAITISTQPARLRIFLLALSVATLLLLITPTPTYAASSSACSDGQVAYLDPTDGLICKSLASILGAAADTKVCPTGEYLAGFDTGAGDDTEDGAFRCRPDAQGVSGGVTVSCGGGSVCRRFRIRHKGLPYPSRHPHQPVSVQLANAPAPTNISPDSTLRAAECA